jgi:transaldolase
MNLSYYIDSADRREATDLLATGLFRGVTTNPAILEKAGLGSIDIPDVIRWATDAGAERVFVQAWGTSADDMVELGRQFRQISGNVVVKLPYSLEGIVAARRLAEDGEVLVTAVHADTQVLPIVLANATYLAPFVGRMDQAGRDGLDAALGMQRALRGLDTDTRLLAGSLRQPAQVLQLAQAGVSHFTMAPAVWRLFFEDDVTRAAVSDFQRLATGTPA